ncbi:MAG: chemotaxis protein CheX [Acidobacteria bacterium]|nr:chemotaxis protein CheX [Acidobacteriota bacterium]
MIDHDQDRSDVMANDMVDAARDVLNIMFFNDILEESPVLPEPLPHAIQVHVRFEGDGEGEFHMEIDGDAAGALTGSFLGSEPDAQPSREEVDQVVGELGNMLCGAFLSRFEKESIFNLSSPVVARDPATVPVNANDAVGRSLQLLDGNMSLRVRWNATAA